MPTLVIQVQNERPELTERLRHLSDGSSSLRLAVAQLRRDAMKQNPNYPCPCGSGYKTKRCCGSLRVALAEHL